MKKIPAERHTNRNKEPLIPVVSVVVVSGNTSRIHGPESLTASSIGRKAFGLASLPSVWTKPFFVIKGGSKPTQGAIDRALKKTTLENNDRLIIRSSGTNESIDSRGAYQSKPCVQKTLLEQLEALEQETASTQDKIHWVIQPFIQTKAKGHLSNERRVSKVDRDWLAEIEPTEFQSHESHVIAIRPWRDSRIPGPSLLVCPYKENYVDRLEDVARWAFSRILRVHFEWVWDGKTIFLVQADEPPDVGNGVDPEKVVSEFKPSDISDSMSIFNKARDIDFRTYRKLANTAIYKEIGYNIVDFFILSERSVISSIIDDALIPADLASDLKKLTKNPLIIRTDGVDIPDDKKTMLPRSDELRSSENAMSWLLGDFRQKIIDSGLDKNEICLIAHNFVPAIASAWCQAHPDRRRVRIESLWGIPEGLYWYTHDTFDIDTLSSDATGDEPKQPFKTNKRLRYKPIFIAPNNNGQWVLHNTKEGPDWNSSIKQSKWIKEISWSSRKIANAAGKPVVVMWFIGIPRSRSKHEVMPWYHEAWKDTDLSIKAAPRSKSLQETEFTIAKRFDWTKLQKLCSKSAPISRVHVRPDEADLVRDPDFAKELGKLACKYKFIIELSGGILSHAYYLLKSSGCVVECSDLYATDDEQIEFSKLVRDKIPELIAEKGESVEVLEVSGEALIECLKRKAVEEAFEVLDAKNTDEISDEIADLLEVIEQIYTSLGISYDSIMEKKNNKKNKRGGFSKGLMLAKTKLPPAISKSSSINTHNYNLDLSSPEVSRTIRLVSDLPPIHEDVNIDLRHDGFGGEERQLSVTLPVYASEATDQKVDVKISNEALKNGHAILDANLERVGGDIKIKIRLRSALVQANFDFDE